MAERERSLRLSVRNATRCTSQASKACDSISSLASVLHALRCAAAPSHV